MGKRHYSKVIIELPESPADPDVAIISIDCDQCGAKRIQIHPEHLGTVMRIIQQTMKSLTEGGMTEAVTGIMPGTDENREKVKRYLDQRFPTWHGDRLKV